MLTSPPENEALAYAITAAPNVLYDRYRQFGQVNRPGFLPFRPVIHFLSQLGVLDWDGNMFITTRERALATCKRILRLEIEIKLQLVVLYMSSQIARLRRVLAENQDFYDYPDPTFPLPPI